MQSVSQSWKDNQNKTLVNEGYVEIHFKVTDPDAYEDATATDNGHIYFADTGYIVSEVDKNIRPYATLERNQWLLDGSREILPNGGYGEVGFVDDGLCTPDRVFTTNPIVTVNFTKVHPNMLQGITIRWSEFLNEYAEEFIVTAYNGETVVATKTVSDNTSVLSVVEVDMSGYDRMTIEVVKWSLPYRRARIDEVFIGINKIYSKKDIFSYSCSQSVDPISAELPKSEISFSIDNVDDSYNPQNTEGLSKYLIERQAVTVKYGYKLDDGSVEWIKGGNYYLSEWDAQQNGMSAEFKARDLLEFMTKTYYKGLYSSNGKSLYELAEDVLMDAELPLNSDGSVKWVIDDKLKSYYTVAPLPIDTHSNCLQLIANAGESVIYQDRTGTLRIEQRITKSSNIVDFGVHNDILWTHDISSPDRLKLLNQLTPGKYSVSLTSKLVSKTSNFAEGDVSRIVFMFANGGYKQAVLSWSESDDIGTVKTSVSDITFTEREMGLGITTIYIYGCGRLGFGTTGSADILNISLDMVDMDYDISMFNSYSKSDLSLSKPLKQVDVPCYSYSIAEQSSELYRGNMQINGTVNLTITYSGAATDVMANITGGTLNSATYYSNACMLSITAEGDVEITITGYLLQTSSVNVVTESGLTGETVSVDNPLITNQNRAIAVGKWVETYMRNRAILSSEWRADPRLDALDVVDNENDYNTNKVLMTSIKYSYSGAFKGSAEGRVI